MHSSASHHCASRGGGGGGGGGHGEKVVAPRVVDTGEHRTNELGLHAPQAAPARRVVEAGAVDADAAGVGGEWGGVVSLLFRVLGHIRLVEHAMTNRACVPMEPVTDMAKGRKRGRSDSGTT